jgi:uncharacterized repeat protein (TIGR03843 family)
MPADLSPLQQALQKAQIELKGQFMPGSNYTFHHEGETYPAVYKPSKGEQPLWDFPENSLALREVAAYLVSEALGFGFVPFTTLRDGPLGPGSLQQYVEYDPNYHYFNFNAADKTLLKSIVLFDLLCNNADRKGSHVFFDAAHKLWAIDHGLCFHADDKLRTVIWDFAGEAIPDDLLSPLRSPPVGLSLILRHAQDEASGWHGLLEPYLSPDEVTGFQSRAEALLASRVFPPPPADRRAYPYPPL